MTDQRNRDDRWATFVKVSGVANVAMRAVWVVIMVSILAGLITAELTRAGDPSQAPRAGAFAAIISLFVLALGVVWYYFVARVEARLRNGRIRQQRPELYVVAVAVSDGLSDLQNNAVAPLLPRALSLGTGNEGVEVWSGPTRSVHQVVRWAPEEVSRFTLEGRSRVRLHLATGESFEFRLHSDDYFTPRRLNSDRSEMVVRAFRR